MPNVPFNLNHYTYFETDSWRTVLQNYTIQMNANCKRVCWKAICQKSAFLPVCLIVDLQSSNGYIAKPIITRNKANELSFLFLFFKQKPK